MAETDLRSLAFPPSRRQRIYYGLRSRAVARIEAGKRHGDAWNVLAYLFADAEARRFRRDVWRALGWR